MKKWITIALCLMIVGLLTVNGTLALPDINDVFAGLENFVDRFVSGFNPRPQKNEAEFQVSIVSLERGETGLVETNTQPQLIPGFTPGAQTLTTYTDKGYTYQLWEGVGVVDRFTSVRNLSETSEENPNNAYLRIAIALQKEAADLIHLHFNENKQDFEWSEWNDIKIDGRPFRMKVGTYLHALSVGETSPAALLQAAMDKRTTSEQISSLSGDFLQIQSMAIDADDFVREDGTPYSAKEALNFALPLNGLQPF